MSAEHDEIESSIAAFLLGAADPEEAEMVQAHLDGCSSCRELARRLQRAIGAVPLAVEPVAPPARLRQRILAAASASRQSESSGPQRAKVLRLRRPRARAWTWAASLRTTIAAAAVVAFALGAGLGLGIGRSVAPQPQPAPAVSQYTLTGSGSMTGAQGRVFELKQDGLTLVQFSGLPQLEPGRVYELWLIPKAGQPAAAGVFAPDQQGGYVAVIARNLAGLKALAVTDEIGPDGASAPTRQPQLVGSVG
jgi:anti-sigma-K factor RskA